MQGTTAWTYHPYRPLLTQVGDPYICRVAPGETSVYLEWLPRGGVYGVFCRERGKEEFTHFCDTAECICHITGLLPDTDYEVQVRCGSGCSRVRLARTGFVPGSVVNYLHPDDEAYSFSGRYLSTPSLLRHPDGFLLASMDVFASGSPQNLTMIFRSDDDGATWHHVSELMPCFWGKLFLHKNELYMLACSTEYGDLLIGKSTDGGRTFGTPTVLFRGSNAKNGNPGFHKNAQNVLHHNGRIYAAVEWGTWLNKDYGHAAMILSCDENADLLDSASWSLSEPRPFGPFAPELAGLPSDTMTIEGTVVSSPQGELFNIMRFGQYAKTMVYRVNTRDPHEPLEYERLMDFPGNYSKFLIQRDPVSGMYFSIVDRLYDPRQPRTRNLLSLLRSKDLVSWELVTDLLDGRDQDAQDVGFQYVDFLFEGEDILYLSRTAWNGAKNYHDSNYITFHRLSGFRSL